MSQMAVSNSDGMKRSSGLLVVDGSGKGQVKGTACDGSESTDMECDERRNAA